MSALEAERLNRRAAKQPKDAETVYVIAAKLRLVLIRLFNASAAKNQPQDDVDELNCPEGLGAGSSSLRDDGRVASDFSHR